MEKSKLILLFGMPRSGTTWIGKLFDSHIDTNYLHEPDSVEPNYQVPLLLDDDEHQTKALLANVDKWMISNAEKVIASRPFFKKSFINPLQFSLFLCSAYLGKVCGRLKLPFFKHPIRWTAVPPVTVWKSIESLGRMSQIQRAKNAFAIQILRHPCGQISSTLRGEELHLFDGGVPIYQDWDLFEKLLKQANETRFSLDDIKEMPIESRLALRWGIINDFALTRIDEQNSITLVYEELCRAPLETTKALFEQVGLAFQQETENFIKSSTESNDGAYYATNKSPLVAAYKWRDKLTSIQIDNIKAMVANFASGKYYLDDF